MKLRKEVIQRQQQSLKLTRDLSRAIGFLEQSNMQLAESLHRIAGDNPWLKLRLPRAIGAAQEEIEAHKPSLLAHVMEHLPDLVPSSSDRRIALALVETLDPAGFVGAQVVEEVARQTGAGEDRVERVLSALQKIEPRGLFARSVVECLGLQLDPDDAARPQMRRVLDALPLMTTGGKGAVVRASGLPAASVDAALDLLRALNPRPAAGFSTQATPTRVADLVFARSGADWLVSLNPETLPSVSLHEPEGATAPRGAELTAARSVIRAVDRRNAALLEIGRVLAVEQAGFLSQGPIAQRRLTRRAVAQALGLHESSVSRLVSAAAALTPMGTIPLRRFFATSGQRNEALSAEGGPLAIEERVRRIVAEEESGSPLSDSEIAARLSAAGAPVPRRMVTRIRARAGIANRNLR